MRRSHGISLPPGLLLPQHQVGDIIVIKYSKPPSKSGSAWTQACLLSCIFIGQTLGVPFKKIYNHSRLGMGFGLYPSSSITENRHSSMAQSHSKQCNIFHFVSIISSFINLAETLLCKLTCLWMGFGSGPVGQRFSYFLSSYPVPQVPVL